MHRVVVTGMGGVSALGREWPEVEAALKENRSCVQRMPEWDDIEGMNTRLAAPILDFETPKHFSRKARRTMGRVAQLAVHSGELAIASAQLVESPCLVDGSMGVSFGSSTGSTDAALEFANVVDSRSLNDLNSTSYIRMMGHTAPVNMAVYFGLKGRVITTSSACTSGSQGIGYAFETVRYGHQKLMLAGGGEELCPSEAAVFDTLFATSTKNDTPNNTPSPFDADRDGLVVGEGAGCFVLETLDHALERGAPIVAEVMGFGTNCDGTHVTQPNKDTMRKAMELALDSASLMPDNIDYICAHGTATDRGDVAESRATEELFGHRTPISSLKGHIGHTLGACGALEAWYTIEMANHGWFAPTLNLKNVDPECGQLDYIRDEGRHIDARYVMSNNFAFGGINTSLIFKRWEASDA